MRAKGQEESVQSCALTMDQLAVAVSPVSPLVTQVTQMTNAAIESKGDPAVRRSALHE